jgi:hypothetical protein
MRTPGKSISLVIRSNDEMLTNFLGMTAPNPQPLRGAFRVFAELTELEQAGESTQRILPGVCDHSGANARAPMREKAEHESIDGN